MENENTPIPTKRRKIILVTLVLVVALAITTLFLIFGRNNGPINPNTVVTGPEDDVFLYKSADLWTTIEENGDVFEMIQDDVILFARKTQEQFKDESVLVGFTFDEKFTKDGDTRVFTGRYYGLDDQIEVRLTPHGRGVYSLSITNLDDKTNIDEQLNLGGKRNMYIKSLPIEKDRYSIRYQLPLDRIVVTFYDEYTGQDVGAATASVMSGLGEAESEGVVYSVNRVGILTVEQIRERLVVP